VERWQEWLARYRRYEGFLAELRAACGALFGRSPPQEEPLSFWGRDRFEEDLNISRVKLHAPCASVDRSSRALSDSSSPPAADQEHLRQEAIITLRRFREQLRGLP
jgi:hypothetical protein